MNDQLNERLVSLMDYIGSIAKDADAFARAQLPDVAREIVAWELWSGVFLLVPAIVAVWLATFFSRKGMAVMKKNSSNADPFPWFMGAAVLAVVGAAGTVTSGTSVIKAVVAPRLVILDYVTKVMQ